MNKNIRVGFAGLLLVTAFVLFPSVLDRFFCLSPLMPDEKIFFYIGSSGIVCLAMYCLFTKRSAHSSVFAILFGCLCLTWFELGTRFAVRYLFRNHTRSAVENGLIAYPATWVYQGHPFLHFVGNRQWLHEKNKFNSHGFATPLRPYAKTSNTIRIGCLGGSTTLHGYPEEMEKYLLTQMAPHNVEVFNFGIGGYTSTHSLINMAINAVDYQLDYAIFHHAWNDYRVRDAKDFRMDYSHTYRSFLPPSPSDLYLLKISVFYRQLRHWISPQNPLSYFAEATSKRIEIRGTFDDENELLPFRRNLMNFIALAKIHDIVPVLTTQPYSTHTKHPEAHIAKHIAQANSIVRKIAARFQKESLFIDLDKMMTGVNEEVFLDLAHMDESGIKMKAQYFGRAITKHWKTHQEMSTASPLS